MSDTHDQLIARLAAVLASLHAVEPVAARLCEAGRRMLDADGAALTIMADDVAVVIASTDDLAGQLQELQDVVGEGPSKDAQRDRAMQVARFSAHGDGKWSLMHEQGRHMGFEGTVIAIPLRPHDEVIGTLTAYRKDLRADVDETTADFLGVAIGTAVLQDPQLGITGDFLGDMWASQAQIHQATGMVISQVGVRAQDAIALLRGQAFANDTTLLDVAQQIVERRINFRHFTIEGD